jgi:CheY-like chemotaxis protein
VPPRCPSIEGFAHPLQVFGRSTVFLSPPLTTKGSIVIRLRPAQRPVRVLLVEDNDVYAHTLELLLEPVGTVEIVGRARHGAEGVERALKLEPDVILMDVSMPVMDGFEATEHITAAQPATRVVMLTSSDDPADRARAHAAGASEYLTKDSRLADLLSALTPPARDEAADVAHRAATRLACA